MNTDYLHLFLHNHANWCAAIEEKGQTVVRMVDFGDNNRWFVLDAQGVICDCECERKTWIGRVVDHRSLSIGRPIRIRSEKSTDFFEYRGLVVAKTEPLLKHDVSE